ncbi:MAG: hypothetical protein H0V17_16280 [Deltaproteobacteria bacterium]|nr:hypothetical protein [Deltaproteobacteria bacterium]
MHRTLALLAALPACLFADNAPPDLDDDDGGGGGGGNTGGGDDDDDELGPCGEPLCSPQTPEGGLLFLGAQPVLGSFPDQSNVNNHIAVGGTHEVDLQFNSSNTPFTLSFEAVSLVPSVLGIDAVDGAHVTLRGLGGTTDLRILDPDGLPYDRYPYASSEFASATAVAVDEWLTASQYGTAAPAFAFAPGLRRVGIAYLNASTPKNRLVDTSATITLAGATQTAWDRVSLAATVGVHTATVTVGGIETTVDIEVTNTADSIQSLLVLPGIACFGAFTHGAFISGLAWTYTADGQPIQGDGFFLGPNCVSAPSPQAGAFTVTATAGGKSLTVTTPAQ